MANKNLFNSIKLTKPRTNVFDLSHDVKLSLDMGELIPTLALECVPGDRFTIGCESLLRFAPLIAPVMHRMDVTMHYFFVPNRLLWSGWEDFISGDSNVAHPYLPITNTLYDAWPLMDYMGIPEITGGNTVNINPMALAAYQCVYNEYYRDQNLVPEVGYKLSNGLVPTPQTPSLLTMRRRAWQHDYFTAALPFAQKGAAVEIPIGDFSDVRVYRNNTTTPADGGIDVTGDAISGGTDNTNAIILDNVPDAPTGGGYPGEHELFARTSEMQQGAADINTLRRAFRLQEWLELAARGGTRYVELILSFFGVKSPDARLQRPEYITGTKSPVIISEIVNTTGEVDGLPQGNMAGHGISVTSGKYGSYYCQEHGYIIGIMSVLPLPAYQQGLPKHYSRADKLDYYWPQFANIGEQEVLNKELYIDSAQPDGTFGYVPRYSEYKYMPSRVAGDFKTSLDFWHLGRIFATEPALNKAFIECDPGKRIFAVEDPNQNSLWCQVLHKIRAVRPMPKFGTPTI